MMHKLRRKVQANEAKLTDLKKKYVPSNNCDGLLETRINSNVWNNPGETARSNDLKLQKVQKYLIAVMTAVIFVVSD